jgi:3-phenylpropionate/trans-cinnamate dioxygenase ferredoxin component
MAMPGFVPVSTVADLPPGHMRWVTVDRERILLVNVDSTFYALRDVCGHQRAPLSRGRLEGYVVECPLHFARFDVRTGTLLCGPVAEDVPVYEVRVDAEMVYVKRSSICTGTLREGRS